MGRESILLLPKVRRLLKGLGENIHVARLRRRFSIALVAERAGIALNTLRAIEQGNPRVSLGAYVNVLLCLGLEQDLALIARDDELGRKLQDADLPVKARAPRRKRSSLLPTNSNTYNPPPVEK